jgi:hypothetical protein
MKEIFIFFMITFNLSPQFKCGENSKLIFNSLEDFLIYSNGRNEKANNSLLNIEQSNVNNLGPFWLRMANQALFLEYIKHKHQKKITMKHELSKKLPYLKKITNNCLENPWANEDFCKFKKLDRNIKLLCLIEDVNMVQLGPKETQQSLYLSFCWLIYLINYLEECQINLLIDEKNCSFEKIEAFLKLVMKRINLPSKNKPFGHLEEFYKLYFESVREKSMEILIEILILFDNFNFRVYRKFDFVEILNGLLEDFVKKELNSSLEYKLSNKKAKFNMQINLIDKKISNLVTISKRVILKHLLNSLKKFSH